MMKINPWKSFFISVVSFVATVMIPISVTAETNSAIYKSWVVQMKSAPRGPFHGIRWFCKDGVILQPRDYSCNVHGGGVQHGIWNNQAKSLRAAGYKIANVFADIDSQRFFNSRDWREDLAQVLIERFLIGFDDGWIFRGARFYRGALQVEDEAEGAKALLNRLFQKVDHFPKGSRSTNANKSQTNNQDFLLLREAYRLLPRHENTASVRSVRNITTKIDLLDTKFSSIRTKIHNQPDISDAHRVRTHAQKYGIPSLKKDYQELASSIEQVYAHGNTRQLIDRYAKSLLKGDYKTSLSEAAKSFTANATDETRLTKSADLLRQLRERYPSFRTNYTRYLTLELSLQLENEAFIAANKLAKKSKQANRSQNLKWLAALGTAIYGSGLISEREWNAFSASLRAVSMENVPLGQYRKELRYLNRVPGWANQWLKFHFDGAINKIV